MKAYKDLERRFRHLSALREATGVLQWDSATMMPLGGAEARGEQLSALELACHEVLTDPALPDLLAEADGQAQDLDPWARANLGEMRRHWRHETALDAALVEALTKARNRCKTLWREARPEADFAAVQPAMEALLVLTRESAEAKAAALGCLPYDALLDLHAPGESSARIDGIFDELAEFIPDFLSRVLDRQGAQPKPIPLEGPFPQAKQEALARRLMSAVGFDFDHGRLDTSLHPFCGGVPEDLRVTTRYDEADFTTAMMGVLHETGHALYDRGLPRAWRLQPVGEACGMAIHESQSLLIEMQICRSPEFIGYLAPLARKAFGGKGAAWEPDNLIRLFNRVAPDFIRVDADEVTYPAHVILRYRLEKRLISGALDLADLPEAWNAGMKSLLGITPPNDRLGCLQDIHWYDGAWGYFPTYTLGAMAAAQLYGAAKAAHPEIPGAVAAGDFGPLLEWLGEKVHAQGSLYGAEELLERATGKPLDPKVYQAHLKARYLG